jgi:hypothetical protein
MSQILQILLKIPNLNFTKICPEGVTLVRARWRAVGRDISRQHSLQILLKIPNLNFTKIRPEGETLVRARRRTVGRDVSRQPLAYLCMFECNIEWRGDTLSERGGRCVCVCLCVSAPGAWPDLFCWPTLQSQGPRAALLWLTIGYVNQTKWLVVIPATAVLFIVCHCRVFCCSVFDYHVLSNNLSYRWGLSIT